MGGLGVVLDEPGRQSGLREELKEPLGASRKPRQDCPAPRDVGELCREAQGAYSA